MSSQNRIELGYMSIEKGTWAKDWDNDGNPVVDEAYGSEVVIHAPTATVCFNYPLSREVMVTFTANNTNKGFTRKEISEKIMKQYHKIYDEEDAAVGDPGTISNMMFNRQRSNGPYGIWGH